MKKIIRNIRRLEKFGGKKHATPPKKAKTQKKPNTPYFKPNGIMECINMKILIHFFK